MIGVVDIFKTAIFAISLLINTVSANAQGKVTLCSVEFVEERSIFGSNWVKIYAWTKAASKEDRLATIKSLARSIILNTSFDDTTVFLFDPEKIKIELGWGIDQSIAFIEYAPTPDNIAKNKQIWKGSVSVGKFNKKESWYDDREQITDDMNSVVAIDPNELCGWKQIQKHLGHE